MDDRRINVPIMPPIIQNINIIIPPEDPARILLTAEEGSQLLTAFLTDQYSRNNPGKIISKNENRIRTISMWSNSPMTAESTNSNKKKTGVFQEKPTTVVAAILSCLDFLMLLINNQISAA